MRGGAKAHAARVLSRGGRAPPADGPWAVRAGATRPTLAGVVWAQPDPPPAASTLGKGRGERARGAHRPPPPGGQGLLA